MISRRPSPGLPPHVDPTDPRTLRWEIDQIKEDICDLREGLADLKSKPTALDTAVTAAQRLPWERVAVPLLIVIGVKMGWISFEFAQSLLGR